CALPISGDDQRHGSARRGMTGRLAFLLSRRWLGFAAVALLVSVACVFLGRWQLHRYEDKDHRAELVRENYDAAPVPLADLLADPQASWPDDLTWRPVQVEGHYLQPALTLPKRPIEGSPADQVLAVFAADVGDQDWLLVVDRGWYATDSFADHSPQHELPSGEVPLIAHLVAAEPPRDGHLGPRTLPHINPEQLPGAPQAVNTQADLGGADVDTGTYGILAAESPSADQPPQPLPRPSTDLGNHLSYTFQWWVFGIGAWVAYGVMARREMIERAEARAQTTEAGAEPAGAEAQAAEPAARSAGARTRWDDPGHHRGSAPARKRPRFTMADDAEEDALIDAQLQQQDPGPAAGTATAADTGEDSQGDQARETNST